mgnify:FL=1|tara:strand:- start:200 stop:637 length:438 start_codon:yes stop_codon:yes gene_type:complete
MKLLIKTILISVILFSNAVAKDGFGEVKFTSQSFENFLAYLRGDGDQNAQGVMMSSGMPLGFAINQKGNNTFYYYCPKKYGDNCMPNAHMMAQNKCTNRSKKRGDGRCFVFAKGRKIVWDSANIKIPKKVTVDQVREIFKENGWY